MAIAYLKPKVVVVVVTIINDSSIEFLKREKTSILESKSYVHTNWFEFPSPCHMGKELLAARLSNPECYI